MQVIIWENQYLGGGTYGKVHAIQYEGKKVSGHAHNTLVALHQMQMAQLNLSCMAQPLRHLSISNPGVHLVSHLCHVCVCVYVSHTMQLAAKVMPLNSFWGMQAFTKEIRAMQHGLNIKDGFMPMLYVSVDWVGQKGIIIMPRLKMSLADA